MGMGNLNPGTQHTLGPYGNSDCGCCCDEATQSGKIRSSFFPWVRKIRISTATGSADLDPPNTSDSWIFAKTDTYDPGGFGMDVDGDAVASPVFDCQVEWYAYSPSVGRYRDNTSRGQVFYEPIAEHSVWVQFNCVAGKPSVSILLGTSQNICIKTGNGGGTAIASDPVLHGGTDTFIRHGTSYLYTSAAEVDGSTTHALTSIPVLGAQTFNPDMGFPSGFLPPSYGPTAPSLSKLFYNYGEASQTTGEVLAVLSAAWNPLGILGVSAELLP